MADFFSPAQGAVHELCLPGDLKPLRAVLALEVHEHSRPEGLGGWRLRLRLVLLLLLLPLLLLLSLLFPLSPGTTNKHQHQRQQTKHAGKNQ